MHLIDNKSFEIINTHISDHWGVFWSEMETVRDFLQNFYDANSVEDIKIEVIGSTVSVFAATVFDWKELIIFGSNKGSDDKSVGNYGEGFKASLLNSMRNYGCSVCMYTGSNKLEFYFETEEIGERQKRLIKCKRTDVPDVGGTKLELKNCTKRIINEFKFGLNYFYHENNLLFGKVLDKSWENDIVVYASNYSQGYVFYKNLLRAKLDVPIVIVCNRSYKRVDLMIMHDRDRKAFNDEVLEILLKHLFRPMRTENIINFLEPYWCKGHKILAILSSSSHYNFKIKFPDKYYARDRKIGNASLDFIREIDEQVKEFQDQGLLCCPHYMHRLGMKTAEEVVVAKLEADKIKYANAYSRTPTPIERESIQILFNCIDEIMPFLSDRFKDASYVVGESDEVIGELRRKETFRSQKIFLNKAFFLFDFSEALAVILHEWGHIFGYDGSRSFTDALTEFIALIIDNHTVFGKYASLWEMNVDRIENDRLNNVQSLSIASRVERLTIKEKNKILKLIPEDDLSKLLKMAGILT